VTWGVGDSHSHSHSHFPNYFITFTITEGLFLKFSKSQPPGSKRREVLKKKFLENEGFLGGYRLVGA